MRSPHVTIDPVTYSDHALQRMAQRGIRQAAVERAITFGRRWRAQGSRKYRIDRGTLAAHRSLAPLLRECEGITVVLAAAENLVLTVYRNREGEKVWR